MDFFISLIKDLIKQGVIVDVATNGITRTVSNEYIDMGCNIYQISFSRSPFDINNIKAIKQIKKLINEKKYDIVHCHTPVAGAITRLACKNLRKDGLRVFYTAHGFHFYKGAPLLNWIIYYPIEKYCSRFTDVLITINHEDFELAKKKMKAKRVEYVPGVGIDVDKFANTVVDKKAKRKELGIPENAFVLLSVGELNKNKNHQVVIKALAKLNNPNIHYMIAGQGPLRDYLLDLASNLGISKQVHLLGYRNDIAELYKTADVYVLPSIREGLNVSVMEAMSSGLFCIGSKIRGNTDMIEDEKCGYLINDIWKVQDLCATINNFIIYGKDFERSSLNKSKIFSYKQINNRIQKIYMLNDI